MTAVRRFHPEVRLKKLLAEDGGISAGQALARADAGLEGIREQTLTALDIKLDRLAQLVNSPASNRVAEIYKCANAVFAEAGVFQLTELSEAAHSLCTLTAEEGVEIPPAAVSVHVTAMRALRTPAVADDATMRGAVIAELRTLAAHFTKARRSAAPEA